MIVKQRAFFLLAGMALGVSLTSAPRGRGYGCDGDEGASIRGGAGRRRADIVHQRGPAFFSPTANCSGMASGSTARSTGRPLSDPRYAS